MAMTELMMGRRLGDHGRGFTNEDVCRRQEGSDVIVNREQSASMYVGSTFVGPMCVGRS
jgi:hypothetical protein